MFTHPTPPQVLVVSDDAEICGRILEAGEDMGWLIRCAENAAAAYAVLADEAALFDALVLDLDAIEGGVGIAADRSVQAILPDLPFVYLTRQWTGTADQVSLAAGAVFPKPFDAAALLAHIGELLDRRRKPLKATPDRAR